MRPLLFLAHIFFDDAFEQGETLEENDRVVNRFVKQLIEVVNQAASNVHECNIRLKKPKTIPTPYGGQLEWTMPGRNKLIAHLKDKTLIRHRKRWSQVNLYTAILSAANAGTEIKKAK